MKRKRVVSEHYVNNKEFLEALVVFKAKCSAAKEAGEPRPQISNYIGECFLKIATHLSYKPNFVNYMFREDMICLLYTSPSPRDRQKSRMPSSA